MSKASPVIGIIGARGVLGRETTRCWEGPKFVEFRGDIRDIDSLDTWLSTQKLSAVLHLAAIVPTRRVELDPRAAFEVNAMGTANVLDSVRKFCSNAWVFVASSSHVYRPAQTPLSEGHPTDPPTLYGLTKLHAEQITRAYSEQYGVVTCIGRIFSYTSPLQEASFLVPGLVKKIAEAGAGETIQLSGALQIRDFIATPDIACAIRLLFERRERGTFNIASGTGVRLIDLANEIANILGRRDIHISPADTSETVLIGDIAKLRQIGFSPKVPFQTVIRQVAESITGPERTAP
jgi:UDP-glucose 4-epimerase